MWWCPSSTVFNKWTISLTRNINWLWKGFWKNGKKKISKNMEKVELVLLRGFQRDLFSFSPLSFLFSLFSFSFLSPPSLVLRGEYHGMHLLSVVISCVENHRRFCNTLSGFSTCYSMELHKYIFTASVLLFLYRYYTDVQS